MNSICGADCSICNMKEKCKGCKETCGSPFGGRCVAAEYIKKCGLEAYNEFKDKLLNEINDLLKAEGIPSATKLYELPGEIVNLEYPLPNGQTVKFLNDKSIYLCCQIEMPDNKRCCGVVADTGFILICSYGANGIDPEIILYKRR